MAYDVCDHVPFRLVRLACRGRQADGDEGCLLQQVEGICFAGGHAGSFDLGTHRAVCELAADGSLRIRADVSTPCSDLAALYASAFQPGNIRFTRDQRGRSLVADTQIHGAAHLPRTLQWLRSGMCRALAVARVPEIEDTAAIERSAVAQALATLPWAAEGLVERDDGWELRPRIRGDVVPVRLTLERTHVSITRALLMLPREDSPALRAIADQAVRFNHQLRHARLAAREGVVVAETRLHAGLIESDWLGQAAYAVAQAARRAAHPLQVLAEQPQVAETYIAIFCSTVEQPACTGAGR